MTDHSDIEILDHLPPVASTLLGEARAKYIDEIEAAIANPGKWVYLGRGRGIRSIPASWQKSKDQGGTYARYPIEDLRFATRVQPDSTFKMFVSYQPGWRDERETDDEGDTDDDTTSPTA